MSESNSDELFQDQVARIIGTAILKNDKNYTDDMMALIAQHTATKVREARIDELTSLQHYGSPTQSFVKYSEIEQRLRQLTNKEIT